MTLNAPSKTALFWNSSTGRREILASPAGQRYVVVQARSEDAPALEALQRSCFLDLSEGEMATAEHFLSQQRQFPEGQLAVFDTWSGDLMGSSSDLRLNIDLAHFAHSFLEATGNNLFTTHNSQGQWLYGADIGVHPKARGQGLSQLLYQTRHHLVRRLGLLGHVAGAMPKGYGAVAHHMPIDQYVSEVVRGERRDPVLSVQLRAGYFVWGILPDYLLDQTVRNYGVFIIWRNKLTPPV